MRRITRAAALLLLLTPVAVLAQQPGQAQARQQQMMQRMEQQMQRMEQIQTRLQHLDQALASQMDRSQDRERYQTQERLRAMCQALDGVASEVRRNMERTRTMAGEDMMQNEDMVREMERLQEHWEAMAGQLDGAVQSIERIQQRLAQPPTD